jgi:cyclic pyranopterin phosphate synthase
LGYFPTAPFIHILSLHAMSDFATAGGLDPVISPIDTPDSGVALPREASAAPTSQPVLTHLDESGQVRMVDVNDKATSARTAVAEGTVRMSQVAYKLLSAQANAKGEVLNTARIAGIMAAKRCAELIPLCHSLPLGFAGVEFFTDDATCTIMVRATCRTDHKTGVEMEAMTACSIAALTIYDMCKAADKGIILEQIRLRYKSGGKSGDWHND